MAKVSVYYLRWKHCPIRATEYSNERWRGAQQMRRRSEEFLQNDYDGVDSSPYQLVLTAKRESLDKNSMLWNTVIELSNPTESPALSSFRVCRACHHMFETVQDIKDHVVDVHGRDEDDMLPKYVEPIRAIEVGDVVVYGKGEEDEQAYLVISDGEQAKLCEIEFDTSKPDDGYGIEPPEPKNVDTNS